MATSGLNRLIVHPALHDTVEAMRRAGIRLPPEGKNPVAILDLLEGRPAERVSTVEDVAPVDLDAYAGRALYEGGTPLFAYDESIVKYDALEGVAQFTAHALVTPSPTQYLPIVLLTSYFYTRSKQLGETEGYLQYAQDPGISSQKDYIEDRIEFLRENVPNDCVLLIDGPVIAGDVYTRFITFIEEVHERRIIPVFIVKNSESSLVLDAIPEWRERYNSDLHWADRYLDHGQRSSLFLYEDLHNSRNSKIFCYLKSFADAPLRVEVHRDTASRFGGKLPAIFDLLHYLIIAQGKVSNPQPRLIAVAEMYAREALKVLDVHRLMRRAKLVPTVNQTRFGG